ncbi:MAG: SIS domain-containing protein [Chitinophagaceae bacterium]|nr:SIS domain-containing protein [Chitinophagaceae bacterium]
MSLINDYISQLKDTVSSLDHKEIENLAAAFIKARDENKQIIVFGNGGSGSTASHMVCDILKGCSYGKEKRFRIICLNDNIPTLLAYSNDVSYNEVFLEQLKNYLQSGDVVLGISGSGNSKNIINAIEYANQQGNVTIGFTGFQGGKLKQISTYSVNARVDDMQISEDIHLIVLHILYKLLN